MTKEKEKANMGDATTAPAQQTITLPVALLRESRLTPELIGALALGMAHENDPRPLPLPRLLQDVGQMRKTRAVRVTDELLALGYAKREQEAGTKGRKGFGPMRYQFFTDPQH